MHLHTLDRELLRLSHYAVARGKHQRLQLGVHPVLQDDAGHVVALSPEAASLDYRSVTWAVGVHELLGSP
jgi:hypothetical protein